MQQPSHVSELRASDDHLLSLVVPAYNEAEIVTVFSQRVKKIPHSENGLRLEIMFVNDGSSDRTLHRRLELQKNPQK